MRKMKTRDDLSPYFEVASRLWNSDAEVLKSSLMPLHIALHHVDNYVYGAFKNNEMIGIALGVFGQFENEWVLHSHYVGILPEYRENGIGTAIKMHQRDWALERNVNAITWTFDPLLRSNSYFNLNKLGAQVVDYKVNVYGPLSSVQNQGDETDRFFIRWNLLNDNGDKPPLEGDVVLKQSDSGLPMRTSSSALTWRAWIPEDMVSIRANDNKTALAWRYAFRELMQDVFASGYQVDGFSQDGWYTFSKR